jgi:predicted metalloprotease with PDZ domain
MKIRLVLILIFCIHFPVRTQTSPVKLDYKIDLTHFDADSFFITLDVKGITGDSAIYQFAVTAPGTYSILDAGRFVGGFKAYDQSDHLLYSYPMNVNQYVIRNASRLARISYEVDDTFDKAMNENTVLPMSGTNLEQSNAVINHQMLVGYFHGYQNYPLCVTYRYNPNWKYGSGAFLQKQQLNVDNYDQLAGTPLIFSERLSADSFSVNKTQISIYCYSETGQITAKDLKIYISKSTQAVNKFLKGLPVQRYAFLFHFRKNPGPVYGAWEHLNSSIYVMPENDVTYIAQTILTMTAHEFFHVLIPLTIHSEEISPFPFDRTVPTRHLWFFEGVTEWASDIMFLRSGMMTEDEYFYQISQKLSRNDAYDSTISMVDLSIGSYSLYSDQYQNVYEKGALVAWLLDMRLLELSHGKKGLRELIFDLKQRYDQKRPFKEDEFFNTIISLTHPEINDFILKFITGTGSLPMGEYLYKLGFQYIPSKPSGRFIPNTGIYDIIYQGNKLIVSNINPADSVNLELGIKNGDELVDLKYLNFDVSAQDPNFYFVYFLMSPGQPFRITVLRNGKSMTLKAIVRQKEDVIKHQIIPLAQLDSNQKQFRRWWLKKL